MMIRTLRRFSKISVIFFFALHCAAQPAGTASEQHNNIYKALHDAHAAGDWAANLRAAKDFKAFTHGAPNSLLEAARADVHLGDLAAAMSELQQFVRMGQANDILLTSPDFATLRQQPEFTDIAKRMKDNASPSTLATAALPLKDADLLPEDFDYDPSSKRFFITSVLENKIISADAQGLARDFARSPNHWPMLAIKIDARHNKVWATEVAMQDFSSVPKKDWGRSALLCFDLKTAKLLTRVEGPHGSALGDMTLSPAGDPLVSDAAGGGVYRLSAGAKTLQRLDNGDFVSPQTPVLLPDGNRLFVPDYARGIGILDITTKQVTWLSLDGRFATIGIDGLYLDHQTLLAVQNGTSPERVTAFTMDEALTKIIAERTIERATTTLGDPTHGVVLGSDFYYIANSGWNSLDDHGATSPTAKRTPPQIMRAPIPTP
jgi:sugar lactone lactonase YvrE